MPKPRHASDALGHFALWRACSTQAAQVAFDVCREHRHPGIAEHLRQVLEGHGFASTRSTGDQAMAIGQAHGLLDWLTAWVSTYNYGRSIRHLSHPRSSFGLIRPIPLGDIRLNRQEQPKRTFRDVALFAAIPCERPIKP